MQFQTLLEIGTNIPFSLGVEEVLFAHCLISLHSIPSPLKSVFQAILCPILSVHLPQYYTFSLALKQVV